MPAILRNVAKTDTLETQRQKINLLAQDVYSIGSGGSDLSAGNIKLGDGTRVAPSLSFSSDNSLGIYKPAAKTIGYVSDGRKVADFSPNGFYSFRDLIVQRKILTTSGISLLNSGANYDSGSYTDIPLLGGTGEQAKASIVVTPFSGAETNNGKNYTQGSYTNVSLQGGSGSNAIVNFDVDGINGSITNQGTGYIPGTYSNVPLSGGTGTGAIADVVISGTSSISGTISGGSAYTTGFYGFISLINTATTTYTVTTTANPGTPPPNNVFVINGVTQQTLTLIKGNTYRFDLSDSSNSGHPLIFQTLSNQNLSTSNYVILTKGTPGTSGSFVDLIIKPTAPNETIKYNCSSHDGMGANITITTGSVGHYGSGLIANVTVSFGAVSAVVVSTAGSGYKQNDVLSAALIDVGGTGSGFTYTLNTPVYNGTVSSVIITNNGLNYEQNDILGVDSINLGGVGSGFAYTVTSSPGIIKDLEFSNKGSGYQVGNTLSLPTSVTKTTTLKGSKSGVSTTLTSGSPVVTISSTTGIIPGMIVSNSQGDAGSLPVNTEVLSVDSSTQITLNNNAATSGSATLSFISPTPRNVISVSSTSGIYQGFIVTVSSGSGVLPANTTVTGVDTPNNTLTLSNEPTVASTNTTLLFTPPYGVGTTAFAYQINSLGSIESYQITSGGNGYSLLDQLTVDSTNLVQPITYNVKNENIQTVTFSSSLPSNTFSVGDLLKKRDGNVSNFTQTSAPSKTQTTIGPKSTTLSSSSVTITVDSTTGITSGMLVSQNLSTDTGVLAVQTTVQSVDSSTQITLSANPTTSGAANLTFSSNESGTFTNVASTTNGSGSSATFNVTRSSSGNITSVIINNVGYFYEVGDTITISGSLVGGTSPTHNIVLTVSSILISDDLPIYKIRSSGGNITSIDVKANNILGGDVLIESGTSSPFYTVNTASSFRYAFLIDSGSGFFFAPNITVYSGNTYLFNLSDSSMSSHTFSLSKYPGGIWGRSFIENVSSTLNTNSSQITVSSTTGIVPGMIVTTQTGSVGGLVTGTTVVSVDNSTTLTLSSSPLTSGLATLTFRGIEYTDNIIRTASSLRLKVTDDTPNLYYYCGIQNSEHADEGGIPNEEGILSINLVNPKIFGSGFLLSASQISSTDVLSADIETGLLNVISVEADSAEFSTTTITNTLTAPTIQNINITTSSISSTGLSISSPNVSISGSLNVGSNVQIISGSGNITTSGVLKTTNSLNINDRISITNNIISSTTGNNILLSPATGRVAKINTTSALTIPSGTTAQRPATGVVENGSIRFNTDTGQYEGYSGATSSWSSLGGVRDLDGNTYIAAEASVGANDNTLYFYNDGNNTLKITPTTFIFNIAKTIDSPNPLNPPSLEWAANTPVALNSYVFYGLNLYKVTTGGTTGTSGNEPTHTTGTVVNGTAQLEWYAAYAGDITFDKVANVNVNTNLIFNDELKLFDNKITTILSDIIIEPFAGKKVDINTNTSLVLPNGTTAERGIPGQGSVRFNTSLSQFEGYNGTNWTSLGGVRDVDGNTYIIPETAPGANENILYFYNNGNNTLRLSATELTFNTIDQIGSSSNNLDLQASTVTFNNLSLTIDTSSLSTNKLLSTKTNFDIALSSGLTTDSLLRLTNDGDIYINKSFGTGSNTLIKVLDNELNKFELDDVIIESSEYTLTKGTTNSGASVIFNPTLHTGAKIVLIADNTTINDREMIEFTVISKGTDIFHTEYGNVVSNGDIITPTFDFDASNNVRLNTALVSGVATDNVVNITVISTIIKK